MARPAIVIALPVAERRIVADELRSAGFEAITVGAPDELEALLANRHDVAVAILDGETDLDTSLEYYELLHEGSRKIPALMVMSASALDRMFSPDSADEFFSRPYTADSIRWRVEAMCIRSMTVDDGSGPIIQGGSMEMGDWSRRATVIAIFNPKGGVGKTTIATNLVGGPPAPPRPEGPAHRRRHGHGPRHDVARTRARPDRGRQLARPGGRRPGRDAHRARGAPPVRDCRSSR